jgi:hypothetical protein
MKFRLRAFALHLLASASVLTLVLGSLYLGWYHWPGWFVAGAPTVAAMLIAVDLTLGPLFTLIVARATKPRAELVRDIGVIVAVQLCALIYGTVSLWIGRPLYYAFSVNVLQLVQASDINASEVARARQQHAPIVPHWYSLPHWIWAPLPADPAESEKIVLSTLEGGDDVISMPRYFREWAQGLPDLRRQLKPVDKVAYFGRRDKQRLQQRMRSLGLDPNQANAIPLIGRGPALLVVFDPATLKMDAILAPAQPQWIQLPDWRLPHSLRALLPHTAAHGAAHTVAHK